MRVLLGVLVLAFVAAALAWPRLNDVETGRTPPYPDLQPRAYHASPAAVTKAVESAVGRLPRWTFVGAGHGPGGSEVRAVYRTVLGTEHDVTVRIHAEGGGSKVSVRSRSRKWAWDLGQNARNIRGLLGELDHTVAR